MQLNVMIRNRILPLLYYYYYYYFKKEKEPPPKFLLLTCRVAQHTCPLHCSAFVEWKWNTMTIDRMRWRYIESGLYWYGGGGNSSILHWRKGRERREIDSFLLFWIFWMRNINITRFHDIQFKHQQPYTIFMYFFYWNIIISSVCLHV